MTSILPANRCPQKGGTRHHGFEAYNIPESFSIPSAPRRTP
jgi:hypothetical protein